MGNSYEHLSGITATKQQLSNRFTFKDAAVKHIAQQIKKRGSGIGIRFGVKRVGCSGLMYVVDFIDEYNDDDYASEINDELMVYVDPFSFPYVKGTCVDYKKKNLSEGFVFHNPNLKDSCGCGESFNV